jgi:hypothetical protein
MSARTQRIIVVIVLVAFVGFLVLPFLVPVNPGP